MNKYALGAFKIALTLAVFWFLFSRIDGPGVLSLREKVQWEYFFLGLALAFLNSLVLTGFSRDVLAAAGIRMRWSEVLKINYFSFFFSVLGDWAGGLSRWHGFSLKGKEKMGALSTLVLERFGIFFGLSLIYAVLFLSGRVLPGKLTVGGFYFFLFLGLTAFSVLGALFIVFVRQAVPVPGRFFRSLAWFFVAALLSFLVTVIFFKALGIDLPLLKIWWISDLVWLTQIVPVTWMGLGVREGTLAYLLAGYGIAPEYGVFVGLLMFLSMMAHVLVGGVWFVGSQFSGARGHS